MASARTTAITMLLLAACLAMASPLAAADNSAFHRRKLSQLGGFNNFGTFGGTGFGQRGECLQV
jgi:hypothetical protein